MLAYDDVAKPPSAQEWDKFRVLRIFVFPALGGLLFGYDIGSTSYVSGQLMDEHNSGTTWHGEVDGNALLQGAITSSGVGGALAGSMLVFKVTEALGTRREMLLASILFAIGAFIEALAATSTFSANLGIGVLLLGRWTYGIGCGFAMHGAPSYIGEMSPPAIRGALVSLKEGMIVFGMLLGYGMGFALLDTPGGWRYTYGVAMGPAVVMFLGVAALPSPPRWLLARGEHAAAREAAAFVYPGSPSEGDRVLAEAAASVRDEELASARRRDNGGTASKQKAPLFTAKNRRALVAGLGVVTLQQVTGQPSVLYYAAGIFQEAGISSYAAVLTGAFKLLATLGSVVVVDNYGRRWLLLVGISVMLVALVVMCGAFYGYETSDDDGDDDDEKGFTTRTGTIVAGMFLYIGGYQISFGPIAWLLISEIFATDVRDSAIAVAVQCNFGWNLIVTFSYPSIVSGLALLVGDDRKYTAAFGIFGFLTAYSLWFVYFNVPETKGLSLEDIERFLQDKSPSSPSSSPSSSSSPLSPSSFSASSSSFPASGDDNSGKHSQGLDGGGVNTQAKDRGTSNRPSHSIAESLASRNAANSSTSTASTFNEPLLADEEGGQRQPSIYDADVNSF